MTWRLSAVTKMAWKHTVFKSVSTLSWLSHVANKTKKNRTVHSIISSEVSGFINNSWKLTVLLIGCATAQMTLALKFLGHSPVFLAGWLKKKLSRAVPRRVHSPLWPRKGDCEWSVNAEPKDRPHGPADAVILDTSHIYLHFTLKLFAIFFWGKYGPFASQFIF